MKTSGKVGLAIIIAFSLFAFFARTDLMKMVNKNKKANPFEMAFTKSRVALHFGNEKVIKNITLPAYQMGSVTPQGKTFQKELIEPLVDFLKLNNEKVIRITGNYTSVEQQLLVGGFEDIGEARAAGISQALIAKGISAPRTLIASVMTKDKSQSIILELLNDSALVP